MDDIPMVTARTRDPRMFWREISPPQHFVQFYEREGAFLDTLEEFVAGGLALGEGVIVIATDSHRRALQARLRNRGVDPEGAARENRYVACDAASTLARFMVDAWPDAALFEDAMRRKLARARGSQQRRVRAFGEMVAILWAREEQGAALHLEHLWNGLARREPFSLLCAYPKIGLGDGSPDALERICRLHASCVA